MTDHVTQAYLGALKSMDVTGPGPIHDLAAPIAPEANDDTLHERLTSSDDALRRNLQHALTRWDTAAPGPPWTAETPSCTRERRRHVYEQLRIAAGVAGLLDEYFPLTHESGDVLIADTWERWYSDELRDARGYYWHHYRDLLLEKWEGDAVARLDGATTEIVQRLSDPTRESAYQAKGLVVGHVQSGKTANIAGVTAKAVDAGYRLVIVLTGATDLLRSQTQRRLDKELIGVENILRALPRHDDALLSHAEYGEDPDWLGQRFLRLGELPDDHGRPGIERLTTYGFDYKSLKQGISALDFHRRERHLPYFAPENLFAGDVRIAVVKKNGTILKKLAADLGLVKARLGDVPALIIDDESDQASPNTSNPARWEADRKRRSAINARISELLGMLPRAQYVGYTATPFANVFIDPHDAADLFPKDFILALERPPGYMGAADFHDLDDSRPDAPGGLSAQDAHVRLVEDDDQRDDVRLQEAMDAFVLSGALKLYREARGTVTFRHHTMLIHETMTKADHWESAKRIHGMWRRAGYYTQTSHPRLRRLFDTDFARVSNELADDHPVPGSFDDLLPYISRAVGLIGNTQTPVLVVNSDKIEDDGREQLDFDTSEHVWRILVGGNKLARGFTVEGLTVSYFLRKSKQGDTLMQMGRWFGFRRGYRDLVRLYTTPDLYEAFEAVVRDEEFFRDELRQYVAPLDDGVPQVTPQDVPPLVGSHLPRIKPTAPNKSYNRVIAKRGTLNKEPKSGYPFLKNSRDLRHNVATFEPLIQLVTEREQREFTKGDGTASLTAWSGETSHSEIVEVLADLRWSNDSAFQADLAWLRDLGPKEVAGWHVIAPQLTAISPQALIRSRGPFSLHTRGVADGLLLARTPPRDRTAVEPLLRPADSSSPGHAVMMLYPMVAKDAPPKTSGRDVDPGTVVMAFRLMLPPTAAPADGPLITFTNKNAPKNDAR
ncbi:Z1 domain-containing protein [Streptomonospora arabica]|uniref:Z1 domain-containing protein n=1 Tax=Streptomonospora arabica TaxID=412417 RepID=A0ABV9SKC0_9ACTN